MPHLDRVAVDFETWAETARANWPEYVALQMLETLTEAEVKGLVLVALSSSDREEEDRQLAHDATTAKLTDVRLRELHYYKNAPKACADCYCVYGNDIGVGNLWYPNARLHTPTLSINICELVHEIGLEPFKFELLPRFHDGPRGDLIFDRIFGSVCPAHCEEGLLQDMVDLQGVIQVRPGGAGAFTLTNCRPICPVCIGVCSLTDQVSMIRRLEELRGIANIGRSYYRLLVRLAIRGYYFNHHELDDWFYPDPAELGDDGEFERWPEAEDPHSIAPVLNGASDDTIAALPIKKYVHDGDEKRQCQVCKEDFVDGEKVLVLPCKHFFDRYCIQQWLKNKSSCPECRGPIPEG
ncbi:uncharacterized protein LTR77_001872 [Saxophila tyrrhenica]|uniref:RING-type domain-containing protein n=1 Tax=Saxophila tyrrhenica TaxID=1690608 RepID=A0AAV9PPW9_9PEZI|nr:hypothetical protein LTR77_001872 [Saxophila tyrrhenica]